MSSDFTNDDFVYVNPAKREVMGKVQWTKEGMPEKMERADPEPDTDEEGGNDHRKRSRRKQYYPWGTYRTMKKLFRIEGKEKEIEHYLPLDDAMKLAIEETYW
ncbi:hypothetical protein COU76_02160, partial [Candidatus Peregrinibacteria bacterium CG10_big_fil_rev_8_21_14_0_10_49_10]